MTTKPPTKSRFGDGPSTAERRGAPLPLVTQPMMPVDDSDRPDQTRVDNPLATLKPETASVLFGKNTIAMGQATATGKPQLAVAPHPSATPPEIGLTQHHLPDEEHDRRLTLMLDPDSERAASFRVLRHHLLEVGRPQCVVVSSARNGDGKTTTAINLALALAECGRAKVLLVETHLRRPQLASAFKLVPPWCFAEQLAAHRHQPMMPWSLVDIPSLWLHVAAINPRIEKTQLLDGPAFAIAMERLRLGGYDHIVIDAPPVLGSADVNLMADAADAVVLALRARVTTTRDLRRAIDQIGSAKVAGTVLVE
ncbi:MAG: P-loop NTPase [Deltaproteobacteria bacterium]|nr:P-loop NTPase [Deltaproteobacteria bacterium]